tara:strand:- start:67 stop:249 length:183 start_codon:yes stop_codon:yes gene_type:complete
MKTEQQRKRCHQWQEFQCHSKASKLKAARERIVGQVIRKEISIDEGCIRVRQLEEENECG